MTFKTVRAFAIFFAITLCLAVARPAQAQTHVWGNDGWCYVSDGTQWVRTSYFRSFPQANNWKFYNLYLNGQLLKQVSLEYPGWTVEQPAANLQPGSVFSWWMLPSNPQQATPSNVFFFEKAANRWWSLAQLVALITAQGQNAYYAPGNPASVIGGGQSTPNPNPLTVDSIAAQHAFNGFSPQMQAQFLAAVGPLAPYYTAMH